MNAKLLALILIGIILISGCVGEKTYETPTNVTPKQKPQVKTFKIGETASNGKIAVIVNSIKFLDVIKYNITSEVMGEEYTYTYDYKPKEGYKFLILDLTVENLQADKTVTISSLIQFKVTDKDGYSYDVSFGTAYLDRKWSDGDLLPGQKRRGNVAFEVPKNAQGLKFEFLFEIGGTTAIFELT